MKRLVCVGLLALASLPRVGLAADAVFENPVFGLITTPPVIDATNFINYGQFNISTLAPFETSSTLNYENYGTMVGFNGFRFEHISPVTGARSLASSFINHNPGTIVAFGTALASPYTPFAVCYRSILGPSYLHISATNIVTGAGALIGGTSLLSDLNGEIRLVGKNVDLSNSGLSIAPAWDFPAGSGPVTVDGSIFQPDIAISDLYWGQEGLDDPDFVLNTAGLWNGTTAFSPGIPTPPQPNTIPGVPGFSFVADNADSYIRLVNPFILSVTNVTGDLSNVFATNITIVPLSLASNVFKGAMFVGLPFGFQSKIGFFASPQGPPQNFFNTAYVVISNVIPDVTTGGGSVAAIGIEDILAADNRARARGVGTNLLTTDCPQQTSRPRAYTVDRVWTDFNAPGNWGRPDPQFFQNVGFRLIYTNQIWPETVTNTIVDEGDAAGYGGFADNIIIRPPSGLFPLPGFNETNYPGRVRIHAANLNLENTRIRAEGLIHIETANLISSQSAVIDAENISFSLSSTSGTVNVENLVPDSVSRFRGPIYIWSAVWTNTVQLIFTNNYLLTNLPVFNPPGSTNIVGTNLVAIQEPLTNSITVGYSATMVNCDFVTTVLPVNVFRAETHSRDTVLNDNLSVIRDFLIEGRSLTVNQQLAFPGAYPPDPVTGGVPADVPLQSWNKSVAPNLVFLTNNGIFSIFNEIHMGDDRVTPYAAIINSGNISAFSVSLKSSYLQNNGTISSSAGLFLAGNTAKLENGFSSSVNVTRLDLVNAKFNGYDLSASGALIFNVTGALTDAEGTSSNQFGLLDGFQMLVKPKSGSLLRSTFNSATPAVPAVAVNHTWAATDYGVSEAGYVDNAAIGSLVLSPASPQPRFNFAGTGSQNAIYVDELDLRNLTDITNQLAIAPNLTIYYAALRVDFTPPPTSNGIPRLPEEYFDGVQLRPGQGRLRWVSTYAGARSSMPVVVNGESHYVNAALANSRLIDSDGDGVPNADDGVSNDKFAMSKLSGNITGNGVVVPNYYGQSLIVGQSYSILAKPNDGAKFVEWSGDVTGTSPSLTFTMQSNLVINATFDYSFVSGTYRGLFYEPEAVQFNQSGAITVSTTTRGSCSGSLQIGKNKYSFKGQLSAEGAGSFFITRSGYSTLTLNIQAGFNYVTGTITDESWTATVNAGRSVFNAKSNPAPRAGKYTIIFPGNQSPTNTLTPFGDGYGAVTLATSGSVKLSGALGDGTKVSQSSFLTPDSQWPLYVSLYKGTGQILSWLTFDDTGVEDIGGELSWIKQPDPSAKFYPDGFNIELHASGSRFDSTLTPLTGFSEGLVSFSGGNVTPFVNLVEFTDDNKLLNLSTNKMTMKLNSSSGLFSGSVVNPGTGKTLKFNGALHQKLGLGRGFFPGTTETGAVKIESR